MNNRERMKEFEGKGRHRRQFLSGKAMAEIKRSEMIEHSRVKRGEQEKPCLNVTVCSCGAEGCHYRN